MEKIAELLAKLQNNVPSKIQNKLNSLEKLNAKLALAKKENEDIPTEDSNEKLENITDYIKEVREELIEDLENEIEKQEKAKSDAKAKEELEKKSKEELEKKAKEELEKQQTIKEPIVEPQKQPVDQKKEEGSGIGWIGLTVGVSLLLLSFGAINTLRK